jgi:hypothetical protein
MFLIEPCRLLHIEELSLHTHTHTSHRSVSDIIYRLKFVGIVEIPYIVESNPHPFYSFRGLKNQMRIRIECGLDSPSRADVWQNDRAGVRAVRTIQGGKNEVRIRFENIR